MIDASFWDSTAGTAIVALCSMISFCLVVRLWVVRCADPAGRKLIWSIILFLLPVLGWLFYAAFYQAPKPLYDGDHYESGLGSGAREEILVPAAPTI